MLGRGPGRRRAAWAATAGGAGSLLVGYGGEMLDLVPAAAEGELVWYEGRRDSRRSLEEVKMRKGLLDLVGVLGLLM